MTIISSDYKRSVDVGSSDAFVAIYSTVRVYMRNFRQKIPHAVQFMESGICEAKDAVETARQFNLIRDRLAQIPPENAVYDYKNRERKAPWAGDLSPIVTSCANLFTTADGRDLLFEIVSILCYAGIAGTNIVIQ